MPVFHREKHRTQHIGWLRAAVLGANDGVVSTASLVVGVAANVFNWRRTTFTRSCHRPRRQPRATCCRNFSILSRSSRRLGRSDWRRSHPDRDGAGHILGRPCNGNNGRHRSFVWDGCVKFKGPNESGIVSCKITL